MKVSLRVGIYVGLAVVAVATFAVREYLQAYVPVSPTYKTHVVRRHPINQKLAKLPDGVPTGDLVQYGPYEANRGLPVSSKWFTARTERYKALLNGWHCDVMVAPVQVEGSGLDYPTRLLMAGELALALHADNRCVVDPFLADLALGEGLRRHSQEDTYALAKAIGAETILSTYAGHSGSSASDHMRVTMVLEKLDRASAATAPMVVAKHSFDDLPFTDDRPPFQVFQENLPSFLSALGLTATSRESVVLGAAPSDVPTSPEAVVHTEGGGVLSQAARLMLLAILAPRTESYKTGDRLFAKAWLSMVAADADSPIVKINKARILFHLYERPAALKQLDGLSGIAVDGLRAVLNGNLPEARDAAHRTQDPWERVFLSLEVYDMEKSYGRDGEKNAENVIGALGPSWATLVSARLSDSDNWEVPDLLALKGLVDRVFPLVGSSLQDVARGRAIIGEGAGRTDFQLLPAQHVHQLLQQHSDRWCCSSFSLAVTPIDLLDLFDSRADDGLVKQVAFLGKTQGEPEEALSLLDAYGSELAEEPDAEAQRAHLEWRLVDEGVVEGRDDRIENFHKAARIAAFFAQGQNELANSSLWYMAQPPEDLLWKNLGLYGSDYPMRPSWSGPPPTAEFRLRFSSDDASALSMLLDYSSSEDRTRLLAQVDGRFNGNPTATKLRFSKHASATVEPNVIRAAITTDPDNWPLYSALAQVLIVQGDYKQASQTALSFPGFKHAARRHCAVCMSNDAFNIGESLYWRGAYEAARPLFQLAAGYDTGSNASETAKARLALLDGDYRKAALIHLQRARRYNDLEGYGDYLSLIFASGHSREGWAGFNQLSAHMQGDDLWKAAFVGHRHDNLKIDELNKWLRDRALSNPPTPGDHTLVDYALTEYITDRPPPPSNFTELVTAVAAGSSAVKFDLMGDYKNGRYLSGGGYYGPVEPHSRSVRVGPSGLTPNAPNTISPGTPAPSIYPLFADAYTAFRKEDYAQAAQIFGRVASYYNVESDSLSSGNYGFVLPYFAYAAAKSGNGTGLRTYLESLPTEENNFDVYLARATFYALNAEHERALQMLDSAFREAEVSSERPVSPSYAYAETCVRLFEATHDDRYRLRALEWARAFRKISPTRAWAHALVARFSEKDSERIGALATALYLDPQSEWASQVPAPLKVRAEAWIRGRKLFDLDTVQKRQEI